MKGLFFFLAFPLSLILFVFSQQIPDPEFDTSVDKPAFEKGKGPCVLFDEGHYNFHTSTGRYKPFVEVIKNDGYQVIINKAKFTKEILKNYQILVISNALEERNGNYHWQPPYYPAFTTSEIEAVNEWVKKGGSLLLVADHEPFGSAAFDMAKRFDVTFTKWTAFDPETDPKLWRISYARERGTLTDHPITMGRNESEKVEKVRTFGGQALKGPEGSGFLKLTDDAYIQEDRTKEKKPIKGYYQGVAFGYGDGRLVVLGEAAMLTAQIAKIKFQTKKERKNISFVPPKKKGMGMYPDDNDNKQFLLNLMHYLSSLLDPGITVDSDS